MNSHIKGRIFEKFPGSIVLDNNGIGYQINVSMNTYDDIPEEGDFLVYTYLSIKNEEVSIYGFSTKKERAVFNQLTGIPKIGPKTALSVFNTLSPKQFENAVYNSDDKTLATVKGISKKTAGRIILELSGKLEFDEKPASSDAYDALIVLGYKPKSIEKTLGKVMKENGEDISTEEIIKKALEIMR
ncbi:MAG: Holliday junction branch migration protein RuvA [candidate division WOR-3 bacterium]|nr:Holliday junction branch migration protein RuvA [candidate division WOR-3 bacterium]